MVTCTVIHNDNTEREAAMAPGTRQPKWDIHEAVILLDGYLEVLQANQSKARIVKRVSADLRRMAVNRGIEIDDIYRNENGISYQIQSMDSAYKGERVYVPATRLFEEAVELYRTDTKRYIEILGEAKNIVAAKQNNIPKNASPISTPAPIACEANFYAYLQNTAKLADRTCVSYVSSIRSAERYAADNSYASCSLFSEHKETTVATAAELYGDSNFIRYNGQQHNRFSAAINKLLTFIGAEIPEKALVYLSGNNNGPLTASAEVLSYW